MPSTVDFFYFYETLNQESVWTDHRCGRCLQVA